MSVVCFGEMLWAILPTGRYPGGAPLGIAVHLRQLGQEVQLISRVGHDDLGTELLAFLRAAGLDTAWVQRGETHPTGVAQVCPGGTGGEAYTLAQPSAWDDIQYSPALAEQVTHAAAFVYSTLGARGRATRETLYRLLARAALRVFDVSLRPPYYSRLVVTYLLERADVVRLRVHELAELARWFGIGAAPETTLPWLARRFGLKAVCVVTATEALLWAGEHLHRQPPPFTANDEAFLAALVQGWLARAPPAACLALACAPQIRPALRSQLTN